MKLNIRKLNTLTNGLSIKRIKHVSTKLRKSLTTSVRPDANDNYTNNLTELIRNVTGILTSKDIIKIAELQKIYSKMNISQLAELYQECLQQYSDQFPFLSKKVHSEYGADDFVCRRCDLTDDIKINLKEKELKLIALKQTMFKESQKYLTNFEEWFNYNLKFPSPNPAKTIFEHPYDKAVRLLGEFSNDDFQKTRNYQAQYAKYSLKKIIKKKNIILKKLTEYLYHKNTDFNGQFNEQEYADIKELALKYMNLNHVQSNYGLFTKNLESILYSKPGKWVSGNYIEGIGLITDEINVDGKNAIVSFQYDNGKYCCRVYDKTVSELKKQFLDELPDNIGFANFNELSQKANDVIRQEKQGLLAEITFTVMNDKMVEHYFKSKNMPDAYAKKVLDGKKYAYLIEKFNNYYKKKCPSVAKVVAIKLLKLLKDKEAFPIFLTAQPYNNSTHSPVSMYLYMGIKPLSKNYDEVWASTSHSGEYMDKNPLEMYLPNFNEISGKIDKLYSIYF